MSGQAPAVLGRALLLAGGASALALVVGAAIGSSSFAAPTFGRGEWIEYPHVVRATSHVARPLQATFACALDAPATGDERVELRCLGSCRGEPLARGDRELRIAATRSDGPPAIAAFVDDGSGRNALRSDQCRASLDGATELAARPVASAPRPPGGANASGAIGLSLAIALAGAVAAAAAASLATGARARFALPAAAALLGAAWLALLLRSRASFVGYVGFDAEHHVHYVRWILEHGALPLPSDGVQTYQPPLFYLLAAALLRTADLGVASPEAPWLLRCATFALAGLHVAGLALVVRELLPRRREAQVAALAFAGVLPMHVASAHGVGNELLAAALSSWSALALVRILRSDAPRAGNALVLGALLGAAVMAKLSALVLVVVALAAILLGHARRPAVWGLAALAVALVSAPYHAWIARNTGTPFVGNWSDVVGFAWWQDPGTRTLADYFRFGSWLRDPHLAGFASVPDGVYTTFFADGLLSGEPSRWLGPPWNDEFAHAALVLALVPTVALVFGAARGMRLAWRSPTPVRLALAGLAVAMAAAFIAMTLRVPSFAQAKASYASPAMASVVVAFAIGFDAISRWLRERSALAQRALVGLFGAWAALSLASFFGSPNAASALRIRGERALASQQPARAMAAFDAAAREGERAWTYAGRCRALAMLGRYEEAEAACDESLARDANDPDALFHRARLARLAGDLAAAHDLLARLRAVAPDDARTPAEELAVSRAAGDEAAARRAAREWLRVDPGAPRARAFLELEQ